MAIHARHACDCFVGGKSPATVDTLTTDLYPARAIPAPDLSVTGYSHTGAGV